MTCCMRMLWREFDQSFDPFDLWYALASGDKPRLAAYFDGNKGHITYLRCIQGHSREGITQETLGQKQLSSTEVPEYAYHGTKAAVIESIALRGIIPGGLVQHQSRTTGSLVYRHPALARYQRTHCPTLHRLSLPFRNCLYS